MTNRIKYLLAVLLASVAGFVFMRSCDKRRDTTASSTVLNPGVVEKIIVNPDTHKLTVITPNKEQSLYLPDRPTSIEVNKNGTLKVTDRQFGTELKFFFGTQISDDFRVGAGLDGLYWHRLDLGLGIADKIGNYPPVVFGKVSYNFYSNLQVGLTYDSHSRIGAALTVRL